MPQKKHWMIVVAFITCSKESHTNHIVCFVANRKASANGYINNANILWNYDIANSHHIFARKFSFGKIQLQTNWMQLYLKIWPRIVFAPIEIRYGFCSEWVKSRGRDKIKQRKWEEWKGEKRRITLSVCWCWCWYTTKMVNVVMESNLESRSKWNLYLFCVWVWLQTCAPSLFSLSLPLLISIFLPFLIFFILIYRIEHEVRKVTHFAENFPS